MRHLMADHRAHGAIVDRRIGIGIEDRRLKNARGKHDVPQRTVVSVVGLRREQPVIAIHRPIAALDIK